MPTPKSLTMEEFHECLDLFAKTKAAKVNHNLPKLIVFDLDMCAWSPEMGELKGMPKYKEFSE